MKHNGKCRLCGTTAPLSRSHIIPEAYFRQAMAGARDKGLNLVTTERIEKGKMKGEYERLLCKNCETLTSRYDNYGYRFFTREIGTRIYDIYGQSVPSDIEIISNIDINELSMFLISVYWRANVSSRPFFKELSLGPCENPARQFILNIGKSSFHQFPFFIVKYNNTEVAKKIIINPSTDSEHRHHYLNMLGHSITLACDPRTATSSFSQLWEFMTRNNCIIIPEKNWDNSSEFKKIRSLILR